MLCRAFRFTRELQTLKAVPRLWRAVQQRQGASGKMKRSTRGRAWRDSPAARRWPATLLPAFEKRAAIRYRLLLRTAETCTLVYTSY